MLTLLISWISIYYGLRIGILDTLNEYFLVSKRAQSLSNAFMDSSLCYSYCLLLISAECSSVDSDNCLTFEIKFDKCIIFLLEDENVKRQITKPSMHSLHLLACCSCCCFYSQSKVTGCQREKREAIVKQSSNSTEQTSLFSS
jgi:hypothetical protein